MEKELLKIIKALADENRLRLLGLLYKDKLCVCELEEITGMSQTNVSRHLNKLKEAQVIQSEKKAQFVLHFIDPQTIQRYPFISLIAEQIRGTSTFQKDQSKLDEIASKDGLHCSY